MKIQTHNKTQFNRNIQFGSTVVQFDNHGTAEVEKETAEDIIEKHPMITVFGEKLPEPEVKKVEAAATYDDAMKQLEKTDKLLQSAKLEIKRLEEDVEMSRKETEDWKLLFSKTEAELETLKRAVLNSNPVTNIRSSKTEVENLNPEPPIDDFAAELETKTVAELQNVCNGLNLPKADWGNLTKAKLVAYIVEKTKQ